jgi:hypothetical protein
MNCSIISKPRSKFPSRSRTLPSEMRFLSSSYKSDSC